MRAMVTFTHLWFLLAKPVSKRNGLLSHTIGKETSIKSKGVIIGLALIEAAKENGSLKKLPQNYKKEYEKKEE
jgi:hypothetical protein